MIQSLPGSQPATSPVADGIADASVPALVARVVARFPGQIAAVDESGALTYAELAAAADAVARALADRGVRRGDLVALGLSRSAGYLTAMLGVLRTGAAYLPVDLAGPARRTRAALAGLGVRLLLTDDDSAPDLGLPTLPIPAAEAGTGATWPKARGVRGVVSPRASTAAVEGGGGDQPCCVLLTSGSTGPPKAVLVPHRGVTTLAWQPGFAPLEPGAVVLALAPMHFDAATFEVWGALCNGATVVVAPRSLLGPGELRTLIARHGVTVLHLTAGLFRALADEDADCLAGLRCLLTGGDVISAKHVRAVRQRFVDLRLVGCYGPAEGTTFTSVTVADRQPGRTIPLGEPLPGRSLEILDEALGPVPANTPGELYIGGVGLALGYLGRPGETATRFIPDPHPRPGRSAGGRLYRTGDLARRRPDGTLEFLGRIDDQVKIRGVRVEPAEIEQALVEYPGVRDAVVRARGDAGDAVLAAFLTAEPGDPPDEQALRRFLRGRLPAALIPSVFAVVERLPMTIQGKVDVAVLDRMPLTASSGPAGPAAEVPGGPSSDQLADLVTQAWQEGLQRELGPDDNVFERGGHSLMALRVAARLERALARRITVRDVIDHPTIKALTGWLGGPADQGGPAEPARPADAVEFGPDDDRADRGAWPLNPAQQALWFLDNFHPNSSFYVVGFGLRFTGPLDVGALAAAWSHCVRRQEALRARFLTIEGRPHQVFPPPQPIGLEPLDLSGRPAHVALRELRGRLEDLSGRPFDLTAEAPVRVELVRLAPDRHALLVAIHHIVFDAWSSALLLTELAAGYSALARGESYEPPLPRPSFGEVARRQAEAAATGGAGMTLPRWRRVLAGAPRLELPADLARPRRRGFAGAVLAIDVDGQASQAVRRLAAELGVSTFTVLATGFCLLLAHWSGQPDVVVGIPLAGRGDPGTHGLIGFFTNTLPLRVDLTGVRTFREAVERHREPVLDLLSHQDLPFPVLVDELSPARAGNRNPFYDVTFQHLPAPEAQASFAGLSVDLLASDWRTAQFDLSCDVFDTGTGLRVLFEFSTELFSAATIRRQLDRYVALLAEAAADPGQPLRRHGHGAATGGGEARWAPPWIEGGLAGIVTERAGRTPEAVAVSHRDRALSFLALDEAVGRTAAALAAAGVRAGDRVGLLLEPALEVPVAVLAVLRLGAAYVPVDPQAPPARAALLLGLAGCRVVVADARAQSTVAGLRLTLIDPAAASDDQVSPAGPGPVLPETAGYVMFTSGSSGLPKPVVTSHRAALALAAAAAEAYQITDADVVAQICPLAVDVSVEEMFASWYAGARVVVAPSALAELEPLIAEHGVTVLNLPPPRWHAWVRELTRRGEPVPAGVRLVVTGSDRLDPDLVRAWLDGPGRGVRLVNAYGTTETAVSSAWYDASGFPADSRHTRTVPIGAAFGHARLYVLDEDSDPVPDGVPGELHVGGPGVALGYLGQPGLTASRFLPDPFGPAGTRMYRTGDRVRKLPAGPLEFIGRTDDQVKVRGYRVELAEVENAAASVPGVGEFVAAVKADGAGTGRLIGYVKATPGEPPPDADRGRVAQWRELHDAEFFNSPPAGADPALHTGGWVSSYTLSPIPGDQMREWRDATLDRILAGPLGDVVEIGCGTGMILLRLAGRARSYLGTDISPRALAYVRDQLDHGSSGNGRVRLRLAAADDTGALGDGEADLVVLNSVIQYFPSVAYLERVLTAAWARLRPGGRLFAGDVRDLVSLRLFHASVLAARAETGSATEGTDAVDVAGERASTEGELCVDPRYFHALAALLPGLAAVDVQVKRGRADTEMNRFRYDVTLWRAPAPATPLAGLTVRDGAALDHLGLASIVGELGGASVVLAGLPDARVAAVDGGVHPDDVGEIAARAGYAAAVRPAGLGRLDVTLAPAPGRPDLAAPDPAAAPLNRATLANDPLRASRQRAISEALHARLRSVLPAPMVPSRLVFVPDIPRTASGKVDRAALPDPSATLGRAGLVPPRTATERLLCAVWERTLGLDAVGIHDNFFAIGGDSLIWLQVAARLAGQGVGCDLREIFDHQTVAELAGAIDARPGRASG